MTQTALAAALGFSHPRINQLAKRGMPTETVAAAKKWISQNVRRQLQTKSKSARAAETAQINGKSQPPEIPDDILAPATIDEAKLYLADMKGMVSLCLKRADELWNAGEVDSARQWTQTANAAAIKLPAYHERVQMIIREHGQTILVGDARGVYAEILGKIRSMLETLPVRMSSKCNPSDPVLAQAMLEDDVRQIFKVLNTRTI